MFYSKWYLPWASAESLGGPHSTGIWLLSCLVVWSQAERIKPSRTVPLVSHVSRAETQAGLFNSNTNFFHTDKASQIRDTTAALQAGRKHWVPQHCFSQSSPFLMPVPLHSFGVLQGFFARSCSFLVPSSKFPWGGSLRDLSPPLSVMLPHSSFQKKTQRPWYFWNGEVWHWWVSSVLVGGLSWLNSLKNSEIWEAAEMVE